MPIDPPIAPADPADVSFTTFAKSLWRTWSSRKVGAFVSVIFMLPMLAVIWNMHQRSRSILTTTIKGDLISAAKVMATTVDPAVHSTFRDRAQETSPAYQEQIAKFIKMRPAVDSSGLIKFIYTCIERDGQIHFILDDTSEGDADHDGVDDKAHIMEPYTEASDALKLVFKSKVPEVSEAPYTDKCGTFWSGYAPVMNSLGEVAAVVGVDLSMKDYELQMAGLRTMAFLSSVAALCLSTLAGLAVAKYHRRLMHTYDGMLRLSDAAMAASRAKSDFLASMSHELRTPLNVIIGHTEMLAATARGGQQESVEAVQKAADSLLGMISDILDYSSMDGSTLTVHRKAVVLDSLLDELRTGFTSDASVKGLSFDLGVDAGCPARVMLDPTLVKQVLRHVIGNAIKFTHQGGVQVRLKTEPGGKLRFIVRDTGVGIREEKRARLFEMFDQADMSSTRQHGGAGVGLALCKRLCDAMQGHLWIEKSDEHGSEFHFELPAPAAPEPGAVWLLTTDSLVKMLVTQVATKLGRRIEVAEEPGAIHAQEQDVVLVDLGSCSAEGVTAAQVIALNADESVSKGSRFTEVLHVPMKPADVKRVLGGV